MQLWWTRFERAVVSACASLTRAVNGLDAGLTSAFLQPLPVRPLTRGRGLDRGEDDARRPAPFRSRQVAPGGAYPENARWQPAASARFDR